MTPLHVQKVLIITNIDDKNVIGVIVINKIIMYFLHNSSWYHSC